MLNILSDDGLFTCSIQFRYFLCLICRKTIYNNGIVPPCGALMRPRRRKMFSNGKGNTVSFLPNHYFISAKNEKPKTLFVCE